jgi:N-acetyltransferase 10
MLDYHVILDLLPALASLYFSGRFPAADLKLSGVQSSILLALGLQRKVIEDIETELKLPVSQALALFVKVIRKVTQAIEDIQKKEIDKSIPEQQPEHINGQLRPAVSAAQAIANDLEEEGDEVTKQMRAQQREVIDSLDLKQYAIANNETAWESVKDLNKVVSVRNPDSSKRKEREESKQEKTSKDGKKHKKHRS